MRSASANMHSVLWAQVQRVSRLSASLTQARQLSKLHGCMSLDVPLHPKQMQAGTENKNPAPYAGYTIIQNSDIANYPNNNAQIVNLAISHPRILGI